MRGKKEPTAEELALQDEVNLARLNRKYVLMDRNRNEVKTAALQKQSKVIRIFDKEDKHIMANLKVAQAPLKRKEDVRLQRQLNNVLRTYEEYDRKIKIATQFEVELEDQIYLKKKEILYFEDLQTTERQYHQRVSNARTTLEKLENKLDTQVIKFGKTCTENRVLRDNLYTLLKDRTSFNESWNKLIKNLVNGKKFMLDLIEQATLAYDEREEWVVKLNLLRKKVNIQVTRDSFQMRLLERNYDHAMELTEFLSYKNQRRIMADLESKCLKKRDAFFKHIKSQVDNYKSTIEQIFEFTGEENIAEIAKHFHCIETENFSKFRLIITLNEEIENLNDSLSEVSENIDSLGIALANFAELQHDKLAKINEQYQKELLENKQIKSDLKELDRKIQTIFHGINNLFKILKCSNDPLIQLLGNNENINQFNVMLYMQILEANFSNYMLNVVAAIPMKLRRSTEVHLGPEVILVEEYVKTNPCPLCVEHESVNDVIDTLQKVQTKDEVQEILKLRLTLPDGLDRLHNVSQCHLPKSREIIQKRYQ